MRFQLAPLERATHAPGLVYGSAEVLALEKERLFMQDWLCVGRVEELPKAGDYLTHNVLGEPLIVARAHDGKLNAFYNQCRHRGAEVAQGRGNARHFKCPYHAWTYHLDGRLAGARYMKEAKDFDLQDCRLKPLGLDTWSGWIFVSFNPEVEPLASFLAEWQAEFGLLQMENCRLAYKYETNFDCNWKLVYENLLDSYHVGVTHVDSIGRHQDQASYRFRKLARGRLSMHYKAKTMSESGESLVGRMPWLEQEGDDFARVGFLPPNMTLLARCDYVRPMLHWPVSVDRMHSVGYFLFPEKKLAQPGFQEKLQHYIKYLDKVLDEDRGMILSLQRAMSSRGFQPGRMASLEEGIHHVLGHHLERVFGATQP